MASNTESPPIGYPEHVPADSDFPPAIRRFFDSLPIIETERTRLRPLRLADAPALLAIYSDAEAMKFRANPPLTSLDEARAMVASAQALHDERQGARWAIDCRAEGQLIGTFLLRIAAQEPRIGTIGYSLARQRWGRGFATEVTRAAMELCFATLHLPALQAHTRTANAASVALPERVGFERVTATEPDAFRYYKTNPAGRAPQRMA